MKYGSVCSGVEAATVAWHTLGWKPSFFSEIEKFPRAVLAHHYPDVPLHGDFTTIKENDYEPIDLLVGGTPCQDFSVAGLRKGLDGDRGNLTLEFIRLAERLKPRWILWENVPGVLSIDGGKAFGAFLGGLAELGYGFAYRILDAQYFGVPQRRRRVFVVGYLGDWRAAAAVLFERESLHGDITPSREAGKDVAESPAKCLTSRGAGGGNQDLETANFVVNTCFGIDEEQNAQEELMGCLKAREKGGGFEGDVAYPINTQIATRHEAMGEGTGLGIGSETDPAFTLQAAHSHAVSFQQNQLGEVRTGAVAGTLNQNSNASGRNTPMMQSGMKVRRLTPIECERLQGFPDDYTKISDKTADGPRYKAMGNSMAVPVMRWLGERIQTVEGILG